MINHYNNSINFFDKIQIENDWDNDPHRKSAVAIIFIDNGRTLPPQLILTRRSALVNSHKKQIGFPGGRSEKSDRNPIETAARETEEEIGLSTTLLKFHGYHKPIHDLNKNSIYPVIFSTSPDVIFQVNPQEVDEVILIPINEFHHTYAKKFQFNYFGIWRESIVFHTPSHNIWGLTAQMLYNLSLS